MAQIKQKKAIELTLQTIVIFIIVLVVLIMMILFFSDHYLSNSDSLGTIGENVIGQAKNNS